MCPRLQVQAFLLGFVLSPDCILEQHSNEASNETDHNGSDNQDCADGDDEPTASFKEDTGDTDDSPMSVEVRVSLARTYRMSLLIVYAYGF